MFQTRVYESTKGKNLNKNVTDVIVKSQETGIDYTETNEPQTLTKVMFGGLAVTSVVLFYLAMVSLML